MSDELNLKLFNKYLICHADGSPLKGKKYFVLRLDSDDPAESVRVAAAMSAYKGETVGNPAELRKALGKLRAELWNNAIISGKRKFELYEIADAALAAPPRNCDVYTSDELKVKFNSELASELPIANEHEKNLVAITAMGVIDTLFAPATEKESEVQG